MAFFTPPIQRPILEPVRPPERRDGVTPAKPVGDRDKEDKGPGYKRRRRRDLLDFLKVEVDSLPDLTPDYRERVHRNLELFARHHPGPGPDGQPTQPTIGVVEAAAPVDGHPDLPPEEQAENLRLAQELDRLLSMHTEPASRIASYVHALQATAPDAHQVEIDV
ncbi:hypothetical protein HHL28_07310 [Aerophototrophica crusticola]|uniref:Uncharacterized protein n=1 Tax=Aerophototrophica crusticola TaxID=1709002 RepID=A0A858R6M3_9PROT|nr:hypothetical protein HHL28_07310 [Rhodospirillaceae bacterium B3]